MTILLDPFGLHTPLLDDFVVTDDASYIEARRRMLAYKQEAIHTAPVIVVRDSVRAHWFGDVATQSVQPKQQLQALYPAVMLPADLTDDDVLALDLLSSVLTDAEIEPTETALLRHYFGNRFGHHALTRALLYALTQFVAEQPTSFWKSYLVRKWTEKLCTADALFNKLLTPVRSRDKAVCRTLAEGIYLAGWPNLLDDWLHIEALTVKTACSVTEAELRQFLEQLPRTMLENPASESRIEQHAIDLLKQLPTSWRSWPRRYRAELRAIITVGSPLDETQLMALLTTYADLLTLDLRRSLLALLPPTLNEAPDLMGLSLVQQAQAWQRWAVDSFIPHKFWLDELRKETRPAEGIERMERLSAQYANWLYDNYQMLLDQDDILSNQNVHNRVAELSTTDRIIWLIIDGFPAAFVPLLHDVLSEQGLNRQKTEWAFAPLPTITKIGIPVLLNGLRPDATSFVWNDPELALKQAFPERKTEFAAVESKFQTALRTDADIICLHTQEVDFLLHKPDYRFERSRSEEVKAILIHRIGQVAEVIKQSTRKTRLVIATDHGATKCLRNEMGIRNRKLADAAADRPKERCLRLGGKVKPEHIDDEETRLLRGAMTHNPDDWAVAWGYRYFGTNDHGYRHGGLTPEETIVPVIVAEIANYVFTSPQIANITGKELTLGNREPMFTVQLRNPNDYTVIVQQLSIGEDAGCQFELPVTIPKQGTVRLTAPLKLARTEKPKEGHLPLHVSAIYLVQGDTYTDQSILEVPIQSNELDDFFDF